MTSKNSLSDNNSIEPTKKKWYKIWWVWIIAFIAFVIIGNVLPPSEVAETTTPATTTPATTTTLPATTTTLPATTTTTLPATTTTTLEKSPYGLPYPQEQAEFIRLIETARSDIEAATTDLQESKLLRDRDIALCKVLGDYKAEMWVGRTVSIGANGEGKAHVGIEIAPNIKVETWSNAFSDIGDNTLIPDGSAVFKELLKMSEDTNVVFSANFVKGSKFCLRQANLFEFRYATDPGFIAQITYIKSQ